MRLLFVFVNCVVFFVFFNLLSCASSPPRRVIEKECILEGEVTVTGIHPFNRQVMLTDSSGFHWILKSPRLEGELMELSGLMIRVSGVAEGMSASGQTVFVDDYELLPMNGSVPIIGTLVLDRENLLLVEEGTGKRYTLDGPLKETLAHFVELKVWVLGESSTGEGSEGQSPCVIDVKGYGIFGPVEMLNRPDLSDTLRD